MQLATSPGYVAHAIMRGTQYLLMLRFALLNIVAFSLLGAAWLKGWVSVLYEGDVTRLVIGIFMLFLFGLAEAARAAWLISTDLNAVKAGFIPPWLRLRESALKLKLGARMSLTRHIANSLVLLGLIGTVIGFIIALSGISPDAASDVSAIGPMISTLVQGLSVALYTTLVGGILNIWLMANHKLLESGAVSLVVAVDQRQ